MNRAATLSLLIAAAALAMPLMAWAQPDPGVDADTDAAPSVPASTASMASSAASAADAADADRAFDEQVAAERQRIADDRAAANEHYNEDARLCWQRFAVNACLEKAHDRRRDILDALRHEELVLNASERDRRTAARLNEIAQKQANQTATPKADKKAGKKADSASQPAPAMPAASGTP